MDRAALLVITDGRLCLDVTMISAALELGFGTFDWRVMIDDSLDPAWARRLDEHYGDAFRIVHAREKLGFGGAIRAGWERIPPEARYVFHLEDDFQFTRAVPLDEMAAILDREPMLAQVALTRNAVTGPEIEAGGLLAAHRDDLFQRDGWVEHRLWFTTNPSLYPASIVGRGWPETDESEGHFGIALRDDGWSSGYLGEIDDPHRVVHLGRRSGGWKP